MTLDIHSAFSDSDSTDRIDSHKSLKDALASVQAGSVRHCFAELQRDNLQHQLEQVQRGDLRHQLEQVQAGGVFDAAEKLDRSVLSLRDGGGSMLGNANGGFAARASERDKLLSAINAITILNRARDWSRDIQAVMASGSLTATKALSSAELLAEVLADAETTARRLGPANAYTAQLHNLISAGQVGFGALKEQEQTAAAWESEEISRLRAENVALKAENEGLRRRLEASGVEVESLTHRDDEREDLVIQQAATIASLESAVKQVGKIAAQGSIIPAEAAANLVTKFGDRNAATFNKEPGKCKWATQARVNSSGDFDPKGRSWSSGVLTRILRERNPNADLSDREIQKITNSDAQQARNQATLAGQLKAAGGGST